jgi:acyl carrier protein
MPLNAAQKQHIYDLVAQIVEIDPSELTLAGRFTEDYGVDSLRAIEIMAELEKAFDLTLNPELLSELTSLEQIYATLDSLVDVPTPVPCVTVS